MEGEDACNALSRFLIALEELRVRLSPSRYPNIEISDEGHPWFNIDTSIGVVEVLAFPFGFKESEAPFIAVSVPRKAQDVDVTLLNKLSQIWDKFEGTQLFADKTAATREEILGAYKRDEHPPMRFTSDFNEILRLKEKGVFFSYLGVRFPVLHKTVSKAERIIRDILMSLEAAYEKKLDLEEG